MQEWSYLRGGLTTLDRDFGIFNKIHHNIETHVVHHLFSQVCVACLTLDSYFVQQFMVLIGNANISFV